MLRRKMLGWSRPVLAANSRPVVARRERCRSFSASRSRQISWCHVASVVTEGRGWHVACLPNGVATTRPDFGNTVPAFLAPSWLPATAPDKLPALGFLADHAPGAGENPRPRSARHKPLGEGGGSPSASAKRSTISPPPAAARSTSWTSTREEQRRPSRALGRCWAWVSQARA